MRRRAILDWHRWLIPALIVALTGCATDRYLSEEQDAKFKAFCERQGCEVVPTPIWKQIEILLRQLGFVIDA